MEVLEKYIYNAFVALDDRDMQCVIPSDWLLIPDHL